MAKGRARTSAQAVRQNSAGERTVELGGQAFTALGAAAVDDGTAIGGTHAGTKTVSTFSADFTGLICSFHNARSPYRYWNDDV